MGCPLGRAVWPVRRVITCTLGPLLRRILGTFLAVLRSLSIVGLEARGADHCRSPVSDRSYSRKLRFQHRGFSETRSHMPAYLKVRGRRRAGLFSEFPRRGLLGNFPTLVMHQAA